MMEIFKRLNRKESAVDDRRRFFRLRGVNLIRVSDEGDGGIVREKVTNIVDFSEGGLSFTLKERLEKGQLVRVIFNVPEKGRDIFAKAEVVWVRKKPGKRGFASGISFLEIEPADREVLNKIVSDFLKKD